MSCLRIGYPSADEHCRGTLAPAADWILADLCCYSYQHPYTRTVHLTSRPNFHPCTSPLYQLTLRCSAVSVTGIRPVHLPGPQSRPVSCYAFFKGWLLLSPPPGCLRLRTQFHVSLSRYLGTLTSGWIHFLTDPKLTPEALNPSVYDDRRFGV